MAKSVRKKRSSKSKKQNSLASNLKGENKGDNSEESQLIIIDEDAGLIFETEDDLHKYFQSCIDTLEKTYAAHREENDFNDDEQLELESHLDNLLNTPDEVWMDTQSMKDHKLHVFYSKITAEETFHYVAITYVSAADQHPSFVLFHFPTRSENLARVFCKNELVFDRRVELAQAGSLEGDALSEGDPLSLGLYEAMLTLRSDKDVAKEKFKEFHSLREDTIENPDEIWRKTDHNGNVLVCFIKEYPDQSPADLHYVAVTQEDEQSGVHALLFSFPTTDKGLLDRYRQGENLQAEEVVQESSH